MGRLAAELRRLQVIEKLVTYRAMRLRLDCMKYLEYCDTINIKIFEIDNRCMNIANASQQAFSDAVVCSNAVSATSLIEFSDTLDVASQICRKELIAFRTTKREVTQKLHRSQAAFTKQDNDRQLILKKLERKRRKASSYAEIALEIEIEELCLNNRSAARADLEI
jgi:hypothetical protein